MNISAVSFTSTTASPRCIPKAGKQSCTNPYKVSDILPVTVGIGAGLMVAYAIQSGKVDGVAKKLKNFVKIA